MEIYALYGRSGSGKSSSALTFAYDHGIPAIIDDGLLIHNGTKSAGVSAKEEKNYITAVKRAIFHYDDHAEQVRNTLDLLAIDKLLVIGTSKNMIEKIVSRLALGKVDHYVKIEDIRSSGELKAALFARHTRGDHIIPVPHAQVEKKLFKKLIDQGIKVFSPKKELIGETTIVQPFFHNYTINISSTVFEAIAAHAAESIPEVVSCDRVDIQLEGVPSLKVTLTMQYGPNLELKPILEGVQKKIIDDYMHYLDLELDSVRLQVNKLVTKKKSNSS
ncbi:MAG TPA: hypothetical protein VFK44_13590 [Bacillales bacterium]|nr:hypothetical protein [Bacillales bacterium]